MESSNNTPNSSVPAQVVSHSDESRLRGAEGQPIDRLNPNATGATTSTPHSNPVQSPAESGFSQGDSSQAPRILNSRYQDFRYASGESASAFAGFDETDTRIQPGEFYVYRDAQFARKGYF
ncbi:hypothetical protein [Pectobacterium phage Mimer]|nr:internal scaffolding protein [Pectobacterium phage Mimer]